MTQPKYIKKRIFDDEQISLLEDLMSKGTYKKGGVSNYSSGGQNEQGVILEEEARKCVISTFNVMYYPDISSSLIKFISSTNPNVETSTHFAKELQFIRYEKGGKFIMHRDTNNYDLKPRLYTTITMMKRSSDLRGGDLLLFDDKTLTPHKVQFENYETVAFQSNILHECTEILEGTRTILIGWIYEFSRTPEFFANEAKKTC